MHVCLIADFVTNVFLVIVEKAGKTDVPEIDKKLSSRYLLCSSGSLLICLLKISLCATIICMLVIFRWYTMVKRACVFPYLLDWVLQNMTNPSIRCSLDLNYFHLHRSIFVNTCRYLVPADITVGQFVYVVRKRIKLSPEKAIFVFVKNTLPPTGINWTNIAIHSSLLLLHCYVLIFKYSLVAASLMSAIYEENKDEDGFLYMTYSGENTFGSA